MKKIFCVDAGGEGVESALKAAFIKFGEKCRLTQGESKDPLALSESIQQSFLENTGTDAVVISFSGAFHGRGLGPMSATHSKPIHKADLPAFPWPMAPFPANRFPLKKFAKENARLEKECLQVFASLLEQYKGRVAAVLIEPIQSEGGDRHASPSFFQQVQKLSKEAGAAFILDEVQTGVGQSGTLWAHESFELSESPDIVCFGKKMQLGGFFCTAAYDIQQFGRMYQTRNGDRARAMLALKTLETIETENLLQNVTQTGNYFLSRLEELANRYPALLTEPRGRGFLLAFDLPNPKTRNEFLTRALQIGVFASYTGTRSIRLRPHLITNVAQVDIAFKAFDSVLKDLSK